MTKLDQVQNYEQAVFSDPLFGPSFGGGADLQICDNCNTVNSSVSNLGVTFSIPEEIFKEEDI